MKSGAGTRSGLAPAAACANLSLDRAATGGADPDHVRRDRRRAPETVYWSPFAAAAAAALTDAEESMAKASAGHILVDSESECLSLKQQIEDGADFARLAAKHSKCPSGSRGGALGEFEPGRMVREFDEVVFSAPVNSVQGPVKTQFGYHLVEVTSRTD